MGEIRLELPEIDKIISNQEKIMQMLRSLIDTPLSPKQDEDRMMTSSEIMGFLRCGRKKLDQLVETGVIQKIDAFGPRSRYRMVKHDRARIPSVQ
jgi:hypothetical protein